MALQKDTKNAIDGASKQRGGFEESGFKEKILIFRKDRDGTRLMKCDTHTY